MENLKEQRWEYRIWPPEGVPALDMVSQKGQIQKSEYRTDTYIITADTDLLSKLRGNRLFEVKRRCASREGFEQWGISIRSAFPLSPESLNDLPQSLSRPVGCETPESLERMAVESGALVASIRKHRRLFDIDTVQAEITEILGGGLPTLSIALEGEEFDRTRAVANDLGLTAFPNRDYGAALRAAA